VAMATSTCVGCAEQQPKAAFSNRQWAMPSGQRQCKICVVAKQHDRRRGSVVTRLKATSHADLVELVYALIKRGDTTSEAVDALLPSRRQPQSRPQSPRKAPPQSPEQPPQPATETPCPLHSLAPELLLCILVALPTVSDRCQARCICSAFSEGVVEQSLQLKGEVVAFVWEQPTYAIKSGLSLGYPPRHTLGFFMFHNAVDGRPIYQKSGGSPHFKAVDSKVEQETWLMYEKGEWKAGYISTFGRQNPRFAPGQADFKAKSDATRPTLVSSTWSANDLWDGWVGAHSLRCISGAAIEAELASAIPVILVGILEDWGCHSGCRKMGISHILGTYAPNRRVRGRPSYVKQDDPSLTLLHTGVSWVVMQQMPDTEQPKRLAHVQDGCLLAHQIAADWTPRDIRCQDARLDPLHSVWGERWELDAETGKYGYRPYRPECAPHECPPPPPRPQP